MRDAHAGVEEIIKAEQARDAACAELARAEKALDMNLRTKLMESLAPAVAQFNALEYNLLRRRDSEAKGRRIIIVQVDNKLHVVLPVQQFRGEPGDPIVHGTSITEANIGEVTDLPLEVLRKVVWRCGSDLAHPLAAPEGNTYAVMACVESEQGGYEFKLPRGLGTYRCPAQAISTLLRELSGYLRRGQA